MKKCFNVLMFFMVLSAASLALTGCHAPIGPRVPPGPNKDWAITVNWSYDFTNFMQCSATVTKGCVSGFTWGYIQGAVQVPLKTSSPAVCAGSAQPAACTDTTNSILGIGPTVFYVQANGFDNNGAAVASKQGNSPSQNVEIGAPTNIVGTLK